MNTAIKNPDSYRKIAASKLAYDQYAKLNAIAQLKQTTVSALIRKLILNYLDQQTLIKKSSEK